MVRKIQTRTRQKRLTAAFRHFARRLSEEVYTFEDEIPGPRPAQIRKSVQKLVRQSKVVSNKTNETRSCIFQCVF